MMLTAAAHTQRKAGTTGRGGRPLVGDRVSQLTLGHGAQEGRFIEMTFHGNGPKTAAVAIPAVVATTAGTIIPIALRSLARIACRAAVPLGWRVACSPPRHMRRAFKFMPRLHAPRQRVEPFGIDASACKPSAQSHLVERLSFVANRDGHNQSRKVPHDAAYSSQGLGNV